MSDDRRSHGYRTWEYKIDRTLADRLTGHTHDDMEVLDETVEVYLNNLGKVGWEVFDMVRGPGGPLLFLKRSIEFKEW